MTGEKIFSYFKIRLNLIKYFFGWPLSLLAIIFIIHLIFTSSKNVIIHVNAINWSFLALGIFCFIIYFSLRSFLWQKILDFRGYNVNLKISIYLWIISELKRYIPGNIWSLLGRVQRFEKEGVDIKDTIASMISESALLVLSTAILSIPSLPFFISILLPSFKFAGILYPIILISITLAVSIYIIHGNMLQKFRNSQNKIIGVLKHILISPFSWQENIKLLLLGVITFFFFTLGTYFSILSIAFLNFNFITTYLSLISLSMLVGYLSLLTPMGLGVREGLIVFGFSRFLPVSTAGIIALFSRVVLIISELLFFLLILELRHYFSDKK